MIFLGFLDERVVFFIVAGVQATIATFGWETQGKVRKNISGRSEQKKFMKK